MVKDKNMWNQLRELLKENFPNDSDKELEMKFNSLENYDEEWYDKNIVLFVPEFRGILIAVGIRCEGTQKKRYFYTEAGKELIEFMTSNFN